MPKKKQPTTTMKTESASRKKVLKKSAQEKKASPKKAPVKKQGSASNPRSATAKKRTSKKAVRKTVKEQAAAVQLPSDMSPRAVEKAWLLQQELDTHLQRAMYRIAYVTAVCFLLVGVSLLASNSVLPKLANHEQLANLAETETNTHTDTSEYNLTYKPNIQLETEIPQHVTDPLKVYFRVSGVTAVDDITAKVLNTEARIAEQLSVTRVSDEKYAVIIPADKLQSGYYGFFLRAQNTVGETFYDTNEFWVGEVISDTESVIVQEDVADSTDENSKNDLDSTSSLVTIKDASVDMEEIAVADEEPAADTSETGLVKEDIRDKFYIKSLDSTELTGISVLNVRAPLELSRIELYARPLHSLHNRFITLATKRSDGWVFVFDTENIPNGTYEFTARTTYDGESLKTESVVLVVNNMPKPVDTVVDASTILTITDTSEGDVTYEPRPYVKVDPPTESETPNESHDAVADGANSLAADVAEETDRLLRENADDINELLKRYSAAVQTGDELLITQATDALEDRRKKIATDTLQNKRVQDISDNIDEVLVKKVADLQNRVETFERIRKDRSGGKSAADSDGDGISDYDEVHLYQTDPALADSDNDGFADGIELMRGYNPTDESPEAIIAFESPKESVGLVRDDVLQVSAVVPVIPLEPDRAEEPVKAEIRGVALPNSFVTLYIYSTPTVVTVKTDADGAFVYTFEKELEDGRHDVYIAVTDNAGEIVAQSSPFSFVKQAQAFTPVDAEAAQVVTTADAEVARESNYSLVVGMGILAFGLILLMLGITLRPRDKEKIAANASESFGETSGTYSAASKEHIDAS